MPSRSSIAKNDVRRGKKAEGDSGKKAGHCGGGGKKTGKGNGYVCRPPQTSGRAWGMHHDGHENWKNPRRAKPKLPTQALSAALEPKYLQPSWGWLAEFEADIRTEAIRRQAEMEMWRAYAGNILRCASWATGQVHTLHSQSGTPSGTPRHESRLSSGTPSGTPSGTLSLVHTLHSQESSVAHQDMRAGCQIAPRRRIRRRLPFLKNKIAEYWQKRFARESDGPCGVVYINSLSGNTRITVAVNEFDSVKFLRKEAARQLDKDEAQLEVGYGGNILADADHVADLIGKELTELTVGFGGVVYINSLSGNTRITVAVKEFYSVKFLLKEAARQLDKDELQLELSYGGNILADADHVLDLIGKELTVTFGGVVYINSLSGNIRIPVCVKAHDPVNVLLEEAARQLDTDTCGAELKLVCGAEVLGGADHVADLIGKELTVIIPARRLNRKDIELVMDYGDCSLSEAVSALRANNYGETTDDLVEAIMSACS